MKSVMSAQKRLSQVPVADVNRSTFDRSHAYKTTFDAGYLVPFFFDEVLPGDTFNIKSTAFARLATPLKPVMDNMYLDVHYFFVPNRLVWENWQRFMGERTNPADDPNDYSIPQVDVDLSVITGDSLMSYFGLPQGTGSVSVSALPFRAYNLIYNEWYRDENFINSVPVPLDDGPDVYLANGTPRRRGKRKDYFTSALPWPQKGDPVFIPLGTTAPVTADGQSPHEIFAYSTAGSGYKQLIKDPASDDVIFSTINPTDTLGNLYADLTEATAVSINDLRTAFQIQKLLERDARGGTRYIEIILSHFRVHSPDARLQRPEFLGGFTSVVNVNPVQANFAGPDTPQGNLAAYGTGLNKTGWSHSFTEHGMVIGLISARADLTYQNGIDRIWSRRTRYDFYWPALAHLGEQPVYNKEIFADGSANDDLVFGYQERYAEYRYKPSKITGKFASNDPESLDVWHLCQDFDTLPVLNSSFIDDNPPIDRIIAVPSEPHFLLDVWIDFKCTRPMPVYSIPGFVDHF